MKILVTKAEDDSREANNTILESNEWADSESDDSDYETLEPFFHDDPLPFKECEVTIQGSPDEATEMISKQM